jgi:predicted DCC family thiol-disulfide oxidoreductase YuxK
MAILLFDGVCNLCNGTVSKIIQHDPLQVIQFAAQQSISGKALMDRYAIPHNADSVILIDGDKVLFKSDAMIQVAKQLQGWPRIFRFAIIFPQPIRDFIYDLIAKYRYTLFGKRKECMIPKEVDKGRFV